jgi:ribonuclease E
MAKAKKGDKLGCTECGLVVVVDEACGCASAAILCCGKPMAKGKPVIAKAGKKAAPAKTVKPKVAAKAKAGAAKATITAKKAPAKAVAAKPKAAAPVKAAPKKAPAKK